MVLGGDEQSVVATVAADSVGIGSLLGQVTYSGSRQTFHSGQSGLEFAVLFDGGLIERRGLRAELHVDGFALDLVSPFEVRAMTLGRIPVASAVGLAALHHSLQDGPFQEISQLVEFLTSLAEAWVGGAGEGRSGCFA